MVWLFVILYVSVACFKLGEASNCTYNRCTPTCLVPNPKNCPPDSNPCQCPTGKIVSEKGGECVDQYQCQNQKYDSCNGDKNARYTNCPIGCPSTCTIPNARYCNTSCGKPGCECKSGYLLSSPIGKCIKPEQCPGGKVCRKNEVFSGCVVGCPTNYCPVNEYDEFVLCSIAYPCPSGCACKSSYIWNNVNERKCIPVSECPPGKCSRPNEVWKSDGPGCVSESCKSRNNTEAPTICALSRCICKEGFLRNESNVCIPAEECPSDSQ